MYLIYFIINLNEIKIDIIMITKNNNQNNIETTDMYTLGLNDSMINMDKINQLSTSSMLARTEVPVSHKRVADNYMVIKKIYGFSAINGRISISEKALLAKYDFNELESSTIKQINEELSLLKKWSISMDENLRKEADEIISIRSKELKFLNANKYTKTSNELYNGFLAIEKYFESVSKYSQ